MAHRRIGWIAAGLLLAACAARAADYRAPRTPYGAPELGGLWTNSSLTDFERPPEFKALVAPDKLARVWEAFRLGQAPKIPGDNVGAADSEWWETKVGLARIRGQARTSWIVSPADGQFPFTAAFKADQKAKRQEREKGFDGPESLQPSERCLGSGGAGPPLSNGGYNDNYEFVQTPGSLAIMAEYMHAVRIIRIGGRHPPPWVRFSMGDSIGHWEGRTLVVETTNFDPLEVHDPKHDPTSDKKVIERFTRTAPGEVDYLFAVTNPAMFTQTWQGEMVLRAARGPIYEFACHEGNYAIVDMLSASRHAEAANPPAGTR